MSDLVDTVHSHSIDLVNRVIWLESPVDDDGEEVGVSYAMAMKFIKNVHLMQHSSKEPFTVIINTSGGDIWHGAAIYDAIAASPCYVTGKVYGLAQSMGSIILQATDLRIMSPLSSLMFHAGTTATDSNNPDEALATIQADVDHGRRLDRILFDRISAKHVAEDKVYTKQKFLSQNYKGCFLTAQQAVDFGLADRIEE